MSDVLQGISFSQDDFLKLIDGIIDNKNIKGTVEVESKGFKDIAKDSAQATKGLYGFAKAWNEIANSKSGDAYIEKIEKIQEFLIDAKKFKNVNLNQFTAQLLNPAQNAEQLANSIDSVYSSITTLAKVKNATKFQFITQSDIDKIIKGQQAIDELQAKYNLSINQNRTTARNINRSIDIANIADVKKIQRERHTAISEQLGIDNSQIQLNRGDDTLLQQYKQISDVLKQMISEREQFNELNSENVEDFVTQEKNILYVFQQLQRVEGDVKKRFDIDPSNLFSAQFKGANQYRRNVSIAVEQYAEQMTTDIAKKLQEEKEKFDQQILAIINKSPKRVERANASITKERTVKTGGLESQAGEQIGSGVESGMERAETATESATESIKKYILSADDTINKLKELNAELVRLDKAYIDSDYEDIKTEKKIKEKSNEGLKYIANLQRLGYSDKQIEKMVGEGLGSNEAYSYFKAYGDSDVIKQSLQDMKSYIQSNPIEIPIEVSEEKVEETKSSIQILLDYLNQLNTAKPSALVEGFEQLSPSIKNAINDLGLLNKEKDGLNLATTGNASNGVIVGEKNTLISRNGTQQKYEEALRLKDALDQAAEAGVNVSRILDVAFDSSKNTILELQQTASGELISNIPAFGESTDNMKFNETLLQATDEQIIKLIKDIETLNNLGINIDFTDSNFLYDKQKGFSIIDLALKGKNSSDYGKEELLDMFDFIRSEFEDAGKDTGAIDAFVERINTAINLKEELEKPGGGNASVVNTSQAEQDIGALKNELQSLKEELQRFKEMGIEPEGIAELQTKLESAEQNVRSLSDELSLVYEHSISESDYSRLEEELSLAKSNAEELREALVQVKAELEHIKEPELQPIVNTPKTSVKDFYEKYGTPSQALDSSSFGGDYDTLFSHLGDKFKELRENATSFSEQQLDFEFLKELVSQLDLSDEKLKVIQADFERIGERLPSGNATFEPEELKTEEIASRLKDIVAIIDGTKIISPEDLSNAESILRYAKEYRQEMSKPSVTIQEQREELQQVDTSSAQKSEQADIQAAEAAEQRAQANEHLAESEQKVDEAESTNNGTPNVQDVNQAMLGEQSTVDQAVDAETSKFDELKNKIAVDIPAAITTKNEAFKEEQGIVEGVVQAEIDKLSQLEGALDGIANAAKNKSEAFRSSEKTREEKASSNQSNSTGEKKTKEKTEQQIRDEQDAQALKEYNAALIQYNDLERQRVALVKEKGNVTLSAKQEAERTSAIARMDAIQKKWNETQGHSNKLLEEFQSLQKKRENDQNAFDTQYLSNFNTRLKNDIKYTGRMTTYNTLLNEQALRPDAFSSAMDAMREKAEELQSYFPINPTDEVAIDRVHKLSDEMEQMAKEIRSNPEYKNATDTAQAALSKKAETWAAKNSAAIKADPEGFERIRQAIRDINTLSEQNEASNMLDQFIAKSNEAGNAGMRFVDIVKKRFVSLGAYLASFASFYRIIGWAKQAIQVVTELDTAMMELKKVSNESAKSYSDFLKGSFDQADVVGGNAKQIVESTAAWKRLGKTFEESQEAAQASVKLLNVSEFDNIDDATTSLISMRQAFKDNTYDDFIDKLNGVGDSFSSSTDQIAYGMRNISAVLKVAGNDIDQSIALLTAANDITQDMSKASMGVRTIALRISGTQEAKQELEDLGEDVSDFVVQTQSKVDAQVRKFTATAKNPNGISVLDSTGRLRDTYDILLDISRVYQDIVDKDNQMGTNTSNALLELLAGKTRSNILASILQNPDLLEQAYETSKNSQGVGQRELDIYLDSIQAKVTQLQNRIQELTSTVISSDFIKDIVSGLTKVLELVNSIVKVFGTFPTILGSVAGVLLQKNGMGFFNFDKLSKTWSIGFSKVFEKISTHIKFPDKAMENIFKQMDPNKVYSTQLSKIAAEGTVIPQEMYDTEKIEGYTAAVTTAGQAQEAFGVKTQGAAGLLANLGNVATTVGATLLTMGASMILMWGVGKVVGAITSGIDAMLHAKENVIKVAKEAQTEIDDIVEKNKSKEEFQDSEKYERAIKLSSKVTISDGSYKNISATNEEYEEYISLCNEIAGIYPTVVSSYDAQGNAIINLGDNAKDAKEQLDALYESSQRNKNNELKGTVNKAWKGNKQLLSDAQGKVDAAQQAVDNNQAAIDLFTDVDNTLVSQLEKLSTQRSVDIDFGSISSEEAYSLMNGLIDARDKAGISNLLDISSYSEGLITVSAIGDISSDQLTAFYDQIAIDIPEAASNAESAIVDSNGDLEGAIAERDKILQQQLSDEYELLSSSDKFTKTLKGEDSIQQAIKDNFFSLTADDLPDTDDFEQWAIDNYIEPITYAFTSSEGDGAKKAMKNLFAEGLGDMTASDYDKYLKSNLDIIKEFYTSIGKEDLYKSFVENFNFGRVTVAGGVMANNSKSIIRELIEQFPSETDYIESLSTTLTLDQLIKVKDFVNDDSFAGTIVDAVKKATAKVKEILPSDTFTDILNDETYKDNTDGYESKLSSLSSALEKIRSEGSLTAEEMVKLQESFPDLTEFTAESIQTKAFEELDKWISEIQNHMDGLSPEGLKQAQKYIENLVNQYGDLGTTIEQIHDTFIDSLGININTTAGHEQAKGELALFDKQVEQLRTDLAAEGLELDTHVLYTLVASDQFSGTAEEILAKYKDIAIPWKLTLENEQFEKDIARYQATISKEASERSSKEAGGGILNSQDYKDSILAAKSTVRTREKEYNNAIKKRDEYEVGTDDWKTENQNVLDAEKAYYDAQTEERQLEKEGIESATNLLKSQIEVQDNAVTEAQNAIAEAEAKVGEGNADISLYDALAKALKKRGNLKSDLSDLWATLAKNHPEFATEFMANSLSVASDSQQDKEDAKANKYKKQQQNLNELQEDATKIQRMLTVAEQKHQKVSKDTYKALISNAQKQIKNLEKEQEGVKDNLGEWRKYQDQIDSLSDSIYDWSSTMDTLVYDQASQLASTITTAMSESFSETGLTTETMNALLTGFSDLTGKNLDVSDAFYNTADGVKVNTQALQELTEAEFDLQAASITSEIERTQAAPDQNPGDSALQQKLQKLMQTQAQYFAQYEEMQKALSYNNAIDLAEGTANAGANYDKNYDRVKTYKEAREKGLIGTDEFKAWTSYLDVYGRDTLDAYDAVSGKIERYFTENAQTGLTNFLTDMKALGYAAQDANGYWTLAVDDYDAAAKDMQMGSEWFMDTLRKLEDFGMVHTYVSSLTEAQLKTQDAEEQITEAMQTYGEMVRRGASEEDLQAQIDHIHELENAWSDVNTVRKTWGETSEANKKKEFLGIEDQLKAAEKMYAEATTDAGREQAKEFAESVVEGWKYGLDQEAGDGIFRLDEKSAEDYASRIKKVIGSIENPLSAEEMGISDENVQKYEDSLKTVQERLQNGDLSSLQETLSGMTVEDLKNIDYSDGKYTKGFENAEAAVDSLRDSLGLAKEDTNLLIDVMTALGLIEGTTVESLPSKYEELEQFVASTSKGSGAGYQISTDLSGQSLSELNTQMTELKQLELDAQLDPDSEVYQQLQQLKEDTQLEIDARIQQDITDSGASTTQLKAWAQSGDRESIAKTLDVDVNSPELDQYIQQINSLPDSFDMAVHIDDEQFTQLVSAITDPWSMLITADTSEAEQQTQEFQDSVEKKPIIQTIIQKAQNFGNAVAEFFGGGQKTETTAEMDTSGITEGAQQAEKATKDVSKAKGTATADIDIAPALGKIAILKDALNSLSSMRPMPIIDQTSINNAIVRAQHLINKLNEAAAKKDGLALGTAHSLGTTTLSRAYANGKDWTVGKNEKSLVNEIGQESRVRDGVWELIPGGPHVEDLRKDDIIFNAQQTADLIRTGKTARSGRLVARANGTVNGMSAHALTVTGLGDFAGFQGVTSTSNQTNSRASATVNTAANKTAKKTKKALDKFNKWLEKLFDWIEVRLDRIQRRIDLNTAKAENAVGSLDKKGNSIIGTISSNKNKLVSNAMGQIAKSYADFQNSGIKQGANGQVVGYTGGTAGTLYGDSLRGALRYQQQANAVASKAFSLGIFKSKSRKSKDAQTKYMNDIINRIQKGTIDISQYDEKVKKFIESYSEWYNKSQDLVQSTEELKQQYKELQQTKLDNITEEYETLIDLYDAQKSTSESWVSYLQAFGENVNTGDRKQLLTQQSLQNKTLSSLQEERKNYYNELKNAAKLFGTNSNEYRTALKTLEDIDKNIIDTRTSIIETNHAINELAFTVRDFAINRLQTLVQKVSTIASLAEKRGTNTALGYSVSEGTYSQQIDLNQQLIDKYYEQIINKRNELLEAIEKEGLRKDSPRYEQETEKIANWENQILSLLSSNEDLRASMRNLRWKGYAELRKQLDDTISDLEHIQSLIRDGEIFDDDGALTDRGFAKVALIGEEMLVAEKNIANARKALDKLDMEYENGVINLETYNEEVDQQIDLIQDNAKAIQDYQEQLANIKIDQMEKQNEVLQDLIQARKEALDAKKEYYDWDKTLKNKNKDIAQLQAQINALNGVTNDAAIARRAKLEAQLAEAQEDLNDTLFEHSIEIQQQGYEQLSEDMQEALDNAIKLINGKQDVLQQTADAMLAQLKTNNVDEKAIIESIIEDRATMIHDATKDILYDTLKEGAETLGYELGVGVAETIGENIDIMAADDAVALIDTALEDYYVADDHEILSDILGNVSAIENAINSNENIGVLEQESDQQNEADQAAVQKVIDAIEGLKSSDKLTLNDKSSVENAAKLLGALTQSQKDLIDSDKQASLNKKLSSAQSTINELSNLKMGNNLTLSQAKAKQKEQNIAKANKEIAPIQSQIDSLNKMISTLSNMPHSLTGDDMLNRERILEFKSRIAILEKQISDIKKKYGLKKGAKNLPKDLLAWTNEDWDKIGSELIIRPDDNAILTPLKANDSVIPANLADNLFKWGAISPDKFITNPFVGKWGQSGGGSISNSDVSSNASQTIEMHFDSLFHIEGNVDESVMPRLENLGKTLVNDRDFQKNVIKFVTKDFVRESKKQGIR